jgi:hypothetical protein
VTPRGTKRFVVMCPLATTGGPEALHQLVNALNYHGQRAHICYYPFSERSETPNEYKPYACDQTNFYDDENTTFIVPETATEILRKISKGKKSIWWLSVDNYLRQLKKNKHPILTRLLNRNSNSKNGPLLIREMTQDRSITHYAQSAYALNFLKKNFNTSLMVSDYIRDCHETADHHLNSSRYNWILYNPQKGFKVTKALMKKLPKVTFIPIRGMSPEQVSMLFRISKLYIDFGNHPGRDRLPREAALGGCCVITNRNGAAAFDEDIPIAHSYKFPDRVEPLIFSDMVESIFNDFELHSKNFESYRHAIREQKKTFFEEVHAAIVRDR